MNTLAASILSSLGRQLLRAGQKAAAKKLLKQSAKLRNKARRILAEKNETAIQTPS